ncbi:aminotransferase class III-fold pyridoxal phosphate-dependent enzyme [Streptomyces rubiginosohelvolus]|uniref:aminotransferase class III-fold pyridoxal phosphate-dependent enzyme n=1 Tax=Streptomyces rubiginosohelvolus TaxID=67362 RepID=UPI0036A3B9F1
MTTTQRRVASTSLTRLHGLDGTEIEWASGHGGRISDTRGRRYVDFICGLGPVVIGHADPEWNARFTERLGEGALFPGYARGHEEHAAEVLADAPPSFGCVGYFKHSSDAVSAAVRLARHRTGRPGIIRCGYTGWHDALIAASPRWHEPLNSPSREEFRSPPGCAGVTGDEAPWDWTDLEPSTLAGQFASGRFSCLIVDAYQVVLREDDWLKQAMELAAEAGVLVILDETKTAGRVAPIGALTEFHAAADYIVMGKAIANGVALSLLLGHDGMAEDFDVTRISGTFSKDLVSVYAAQVTSAIMRERDGYAALRRLGGRLVDVVESASAEAGTSDDVGASTVFGGSLWDFRFSSTLLADGARRGSLTRHLEAAGVLALQGHPSYVCLAHEHDMDGLRDVFVSAFTAWRKSA